ncbi:hypothetical protein ACFQHQ_15400 [Zunongwangia atlantica 22II14-10F7]|uniref:Uncharacterized protein n=2 Tax=Zunongwangia TaxID=417127 RepID=A0A1Y1T7M8_9FLAO|nr:hypothetical protein IIF7_05957 [Zunongwangia atlantica 22II14-10F7]
MNSIKFNDFQLKFAPNFMQLEIFHEGHYGVKEYNECLRLKIDVYGDKKIGILVRRINEEDKYSFDPMLLLSGNKSIEKHANWVILVSDKFSDKLNLKFVKILTSLYCLRFSEYAEALEIINSGSLALI